MTHNLAWYAYINTIHFIASVCSYSMHAFMNIAIHTEWISYSYRVDKKELAGI